MHCAGRLAAELSAVSEKAITHEKGNYVLEKMIDTGSAADIMTVIKSLCKRPYDFAHHKYAVMKVAKAIDKLVCFSPCAGPGVASGRVLQVWCMLAQWQHAEQFDQPRPGSPLRPSSNLAERSDRPV